MNNRQKKELNKLTIFARKLTPKNWVIVPNGIRPELIPGNFYIHINVLDNDTFFEIYDDVDYVAVTKWPIQFINVSGFPSGKIKRNLNKSGAGSISHIEVEYRDGFLGNLSVFTHEMAHVAEFRRLSQISHQWKEAYPGRSCSFIIENEEHGLRFLWAYRILIKRLEKFADKQTIKLCRADFKLHENILKCEREIS
jgi:hypothetical protein